MEHKENDVDVNDVDDNTEMKEMEMIKYIQYRINQFIIHSKVAIESTAASGREDNEQNNSKNDDGLMNRIDNENGSDIVELFKRLDQILNDKEEEIILLDDPRQQTGVRNEIEKIKQQSKILRTQFIDAQRYAQMAKKALMERKRKELLIGSNKNDGEKKQGAQADLLNKSKQINHSLERTNRILVQELGRMQQIGGILEEDSETFKNMSSEYKTYNASVKSSKSMIQSMKLRAMTDSFQIYAAIAVFVLVVVYILIRRFRYLISPFVWIARQIYYFYSSFIHPIIFPEETATVNIAPSDVIQSTSAPVVKEDL